LSTTSATGAATGAATGVAGPSPAKATTAAPKVAAQTTTEKPDAPCDTKITTLIPEVAKANNASNSTNGTTVDEEDMPKDISGYTQCEMVKHWETNHWYLTHVVGKPPPSKSKCALALIKELMDRINNLEEALKNCKPKDSEKCVALAAELAALKAYLAKVRESSGIKGDGSEPEFSHNDVNAYDKHFGSTWKDNKYYQKYVGPNRQESNFSKSVSMEPATEKKIFGAPQGLGDEHYKMPEGFVKNILDRNTAKKAKEEAAAKKAPAAKKEQKEEPAAKSGGKAKGL